MRYAHTSWHACSDFYYVRVSVYQRLELVYAVRAQINLSQRSWYQLAVLDQVEADCCVDYAGFSAYAAVKVFRPFAAAFRALHRVVCCDSDWLQVLIQLLQAVRAPGTRDFHPDAHEPSEELASGHIRPVNLDK